MRKETVLLIFSTLISLFIAEVFLAAFFPQRTVNQYLQDRPAMFRPNDTLFMDLKPGFTGFLKEEEFRTGISINSLGYRQDEFPVDKADQQRILVVGDSFTFGYGVEERDGYVRVMERALRKARPDVPIQVINAGVPAWWTDAYYLYLKTRGIALQPDVVIVGLFIGNDIDARDARHVIWPDVDASGFPLATTAERVKIENGYRVRAKPRTRWVIPVLRNSHLFQLLYSSGKNIGRIISPKVQAATMYQAEYSRETLEIVEKVQKLLIGMRDLANESGSRFVVAMIPERQQIYRGMSEWEKGVDYEKPQRVFRQFFEQTGITFVDLRPSLIAAAEQGEALFYRKDSHFTQLGYRITGEHLARALLEQSVIP